MKNLFAHIRNKTLGGLLAIIPIALCLFVVHLLYVGIDQRVMALAEKSLGYSVPGLGLVLSLLTLYLIGLITGNFIGRRLLGLIERLFARIPLVKTTYQIGKQLSATLSLPEKQVFKRVVLIEFLTPGIWTVGFVTGSVFDPRDPDVLLLKVYVPTPPNPTSGTMVLAPESKVREPGWTVEEAMRTVISAGIIGPNELRLQPPRTNADEPS